MGTSGLGRGLGGMLGLGRGLGLGLGLGLGFGLGLGRLPSKMFRKIPEKAAFYSTS